MRRRAGRLGVWGRIAAAVLVAGGVQAVTVPDASAAEAGCWRAECQGKSPYDMNCDADAETLDQLNIGDDIEIKLVWSPDCQATWTKVTIKEGYSSPVYGTHWYTPTLGGVQQPYSTGTLDATHPTAYSKMGNWKATNKACWNDVGPTYDPAPLRVEDMATVGPGVHGHCTDWI